MREVTVSITQKNRGRATIATVVREDGVVVSKSRNWFTNADAADMDAKAVAAYVHRRAVQRVADDLRQLELF